MPKKDNSVDIKIVNADPFWVITCHVDGELIYTSSYNSAESVVGEVREAAKKAAGRAWEKYDPARDNNLPMGKQVDKELRSKGIYLTGFSK